MLFFHLIIMAENVPPIESSESTIRGEFEQLKQLVVQQYLSMSQSFEDIAKLQKIVDMKINAVEMRLNAHIEELRMIAEKLPFQAAQIVTGIQQSVINKAKAKLAKDESSQQKEKTE